jgi:hypothetical protein
MPRRNSTLLCVVAAAPSLAQNDLSRLPESVRAVVVVLQKSRCTQGVLAVR